MAFSLPKIGFRWGGSPTAPTPVPVHSEPVAPAPPAVPPSAPAAQPIKAVDTPAPVPAPVTQEQLVIPTMENPSTPEKPSDGKPAPEGTDSWQRWTARFLESELATLRSLATEIEKAQSFNPSNNTIMRALLRAQTQGGDWRDHVKAIHQLDRRRK